MPELKPITFYLLTYRLVVRAAAGPDGTWSVEVDGGRNPAATERDRADAARFAAYMIEHHADLLTQNIVRKKWRVIEEYFAEWREEGRVCPDVDDEDTALESIGIGIGDEEEPGQDEEPQD